MKKIFCLVLVVALSFTYLFAKSDPFRGNVYSNDNFILDFSDSNDKNPIVNKTNKISDSNYYYDFDDESLVLYANDKKTAVNYYDYKLKGDSLTLVDENGSKIKLSKGGANESLLDTLKEKTMSVVDSAKELYNEQPDSVKNTIKGAATGAAVGAAGSILFKKKFVPSTVTGAAAGALINWFRSRNAEKADE